MEGSPPTERVSQRPKVELSVSTTKSRADGPAAIPSLGEDVVAPLAGLQSLAVTPCVIARWSQILGQPLVGARCGSVVENGRVIQRDTYRLQKSPRTARQSIELVFAWQGRTSVNLIRQPNLTVAYSCQASTNLFSGSGGRRPALERGPWTLQ